MEWEYAWPIPAKPIYLSHRDSEARLDRPISFIPVGFVLDSGMKEPRPPHRSLLTISAESQSLSPMPLQEVSHDALFDSYLTKFDGRLSYFDPDCHPSKKVGLMIDPASGGGLISSPRMLLDWGSNCCERC